MVGKAGHVLRQVEAIHPSTIPPGTPGSVLANKSVDAIDSSTIPKGLEEGVEFPVGLVGFEIAGVGAGEPVTMTIALPPGIHVDSYFKYGPTPENTTPHWYEFLYDGTTGAEIVPGMVVLHFMDALRGDDDLAVNGVITEPGGPSGGAVLIRSWEDY